MTKRAADAVVEGKVSAASSSVSWRLMMTRRRQVSQSWMVGD